MVKEKVVSIGRKVVYGVALSAPVCVGSMTAYASESGSVSTVTTALTNGIQTVSSDAMGAIGAIIPVALPIMGAIVVVGLGIKVFKKVTGR